MELGGRRRKEAVSAGGEGTGCDGVGKLSMSRWALGPVVTTQPRTCRIGENAEGAGP